MPIVLMIAESSAGLRERLRTEGHEVRSAATFGEAADPAFSRDAEVVVSPAPLGQVDEAALESLMQLPRPPVLLLLVAAERFEDARAGIRLGASDVLPPSLTGDQLAEAVTRAVARRPAAPMDAEMQGTLFAGSEPEALPRTIVDAACRVLKVNDASLMLLGADNRLHLAYSCGLSKALQRDTSVALGERVAGRIALSGKPTILGGKLEVDPRFPEVGGKREREVKSSIVFPLKHGERLLGVLNLNRSASSEPFESNDLARASIFATQVVLALENVRLFGQVAAGEGMAAVGRIAAAVAHEINNPAAWVLSSLEYLKAELKKPKVSRDSLTSPLEDAVTGMHRIRGIVRDFQSLTQGEAGPACFDLNEAIRSASRVAGAVIHDAAVTLDLQTELPVIGSRSSLSQAFVNLILNAGAENSPGRKISIRSLRDGDFAVATVSDTGRGITQTQLATLFDPTFGARGPRFAGLGLSISRDIVSNHGGELLVHSTEGEGTVLTVRLPSAEALPQTG